jgi:hypothetical protein
MRFSDEELNKFRIKHKPMVRPDDRRVNTATEWALCPSRSDSARPKAVRVSREEWLEALRLCKLNGYAPPDSNGLSVGEVKYFTPALQAGLKNRKNVNPNLRPGLERLLAFVLSEGRGGFTMVRQWTG